MLERDSGFSRVYGNKARIGLIVPGPNTIAETEFWQMAPRGVTIHTARLPFDHYADDPLGDMEAYVPSAAISLKAAGVDLVVFSCGASSAREETGVDDDSPMDQIRDITDAPVVDASGALARELRHLCLERIGLITPYPADVHQEEKEFLERSGFTVSQEARCMLDADQEKMIGMRRVPPDMLIEAALPMAPDVNGYALGCTDMPTMAAIMEIETRTGKPALSMTLAMWREAGRVLNLN
jgi:maleate cis-trans isomerase